jgi:hypothetical protein
MKLNQIVSITKILSDRKIPEDVEKFLEDEYFSQSKKTFVKYGEMDLFHFIRSNNKTLKKVWNEHDEIEDKLYKIKKIMEE